MLTQKALTKKLTATYCSTTNNLFVHKNNIAAHNVYSNNSSKIIRNLSTQQKTAFNMLQNTCMQKTKNFVTNNALIKMLFNNLGNKNAQVHYYIQAQKNWSCVCRHVQNCC